MIAAGKLRHRVKIQEPTDDRDSFGRWPGTYLTHGYAWASIEDLTGTQVELAQQYIADATHRIFLRFQKRLKPELNSKMRIIFGTRIFDIGHVRNIDQVNGLWSCESREVKS